jgi:hypothetical protein
MLYQLSYASVSKMERGTGLEPATNSVEGCDSTIELPPPFPIYPNSPILPSYSQYCHWPAANT